MRFENETHRLEHWDKIDAVFDSCYLNHVYERLVAIEDITNSVTGIGITKDYVVIYNKDFMLRKGVGDSFQMLSAMLLLIRHLMNEDWKKQYHFKTYIWVKATQASANIALLKSYDTMPPDNSICMDLELAYRLESFYSRRYSSDEKFVHEAMSIVQSVTNHYRKLYHSSATTCAYILRSLDTKQRDNMGFKRNRDGTVSSKYYSSNISIETSSGNKWEEPLSATSIDFASKGDYIKGHYGIVENVSEDEHKAILEKLVYHEGGGRGEFFGTSIVIDKSVEEKPRDRIDWEHIIEDIENTASGNKTGGMHDYSMFPTSRRAYGNFVTPGMVGGKTSRFCLIIDNSGSVNDFDLANARAQVEYILDLGIGSIDVIYCDMEATLFEDIQSIDDLPLVRGGSTNMVNGLIFASEQAASYDMVVVISDGDTEYPDVAAGFVNYMFVIQQNDSTNLSYIPSHVKHVVI